MYFTECARLADRYPGLADLVTKVDAHLKKMGTAVVIRKADLASFFRADPNQVGSVLDLLAQGGLLQAEEMVECTFCRMAVLRADFEEAREEEGEYVCTSCDRLLTDKTVDLITTYRRGKMWGKDELSPHLAAAVVATISLRELSRIRGLYPAAIRDGDAEEFREALSAHLGVALEDESLHDIRDSLYKEVKLDDPDADAMLTVLLTTLVMRCPGVCIAGANEEAMRKTMDRAIEACMKKVASPLKAIVDQLLEIKIVDCRIPEGDDPAFSDPRRSLQLLLAYWSLGRTIVVNQMNGYVSLRPHPLLRLVTNLRARMEVYFGRLSDHDGALEAFTAGDRLLDLAVGGDPDELSAVPEWTNEEVQKVDSFLERVRLDIGAKTYPLTHEEKVFIEQAEVAIEEYKEQANTAWNHIYDNVTRQIAQAKGGDTGDAQQGEESAQRQPDYCQAITKDGTATLPKPGYEDLIKKRDSYGMFIDGMTREALCRNGNGEPRISKLTARELGILIDFITAGKPMRPLATKTGGECASPKAAARLFEEARKKADLKLGRYEYRAFRLHRSASGSAYTAHEFTPPDDLNYCVVTPL